MRPTLARVRKFFKTRGPQSRLSMGLRALAKVTAAIALPFFLLVRVSVYAYGRGAPPWLAIGCGMLLTMGVVAMYGAWLSRRFHGQARLAVVARWVAIPIVAAWCAYATFYLARVNAKSDEVHGYFSTVHPILRVALSTVILFDADLVITDMARVPADYSRMGLPRNDQTRHYVQADGWVHAVDLRTRERGVVENRLVQLYFWTMGFSTRRHVGTADHLHVELRPR